MYSQKVGRRVEHHLTNQDRCVQKGGVLSFLGCASHRRSSAGHVPLPVRSHVACVSNPRKIPKPSHLDTWALFSTAPSSLAVCSLACVLLSFRQRPHVHATGLEAFGLFPGFLRDGGLGSCPSGHLSTSPWCVKPHARCLWVALRRFFGHSFFLRTPCIRQSASCLSCQRSTGEFDCSRRLLQVLFAYSVFLTRQWIHAHASVYGVFG